VAKPRYPRSRRRRAANIERFERAEKRAREMGYRPTGVYRTAGSARRHLAGTTAHRRYIEKVRQVVGERPLTDYEKRTITEFYLLKRERKESRVMLLRWLDVLQRTPRPLTATEQHLDFLNQLPADLRNFIEQY
jgi:hypothetical protein